MKLIVSFLLLMGFAGPNGASGQGTFIYDQQSSDERYVAGNAVIQVDRPGQSFTPNLNSVGFIRLALRDVNSGNSLGAAVFINLRTNSISGPILSTTAPVFMPDGFSGFADFLFTTPVPVAPGVIYYFEPLVQSGDFWGTAAYNAYNYPGGMEFYQGAPFPNNDLWFREGQYVPEPSTALLGLLGITWLAYARRKLVPNL